MVAWLPFLSDEHSELARIRDLRAGCMLPRLLSGLCISYTANGIQNAGACASPSEYLYFVYLDPRLFMRFLLVLWQYMHIPLDTAATGALKRCGASDTLITPASSRIGRATSCTSIVCIQAQGGRSWQNFTNA